MGTLSAEVPFARGDTITLPDSALQAGVRIEILWPGSPQVTDWSRIAENSIVLRMTFGAHSFCFQGDIETAQETKLANDGQPYTCTVYLMGHHGSREANSAAWLAKLQPAYATVSFGENSYGHPRPEALCRVQTAGAKVYATHLLGTIVVSTDGVALTISPSQPETTDYCASGTTYWT